MESSNSDTGAHVPLLAQYYGRPPPSKSLPWKGSLSFFSCSTLARMVLLGLMWALLLSWIALLILFPTQFFRQRIETQVATLLTSPFFRITVHLLNLRLLHAMLLTKSGYSVILYALPLFLIAVLGTIYLQLRPEKLSRGKDLHFSNILSSTSPILANKFLGIITSAELIFLLAVVLYAAWCLWSFLSQDLSEIGTIARDERWRYGVAVAGDRAGEIGLIFLGLLFLPVARGSVLLRLIDVPFEHAVKYHIWLGHLMMVIFTFHGLAFVLVWASEGRLLSRLTSWGSYEIANLPGVIALLAGWAIWVTSLPPVRPRFFELFFYTHQLYAIFIIFMALHAADFILGLAVASIFFFLLDRFLRFCQSRKTVGLLSARVLPCGTIELVLEKPPSLKYHALSFIFLNTPKLSLLQWHPFSVSSSPFDGNNHLAVLIKPLGCWTRELQGAVTALEGQDQKRDGLPFKLYMGVEGPYGDESDFYLRYNKLLLVAGGIGASPFVAILRDLLHRYEHSVENDLPQEVLLVWAVKKSKELHILDLVNPPSICLNYKTRFHLDVQAYVTQESHADFELQDRCIDAATIDACMSTDRPMSEVVGTGRNYWFCMCLIVAMIGYVITAGIFGCYLVTPFVGGSDYPSPFWVRGGYVALAMVAAIIVFGGAVVGVWSMSTSGKARQSQRRVSDETKPVHSFNSLHAHDGRSAQVLQPQNIHYGVRPDFKVLFEDICKKWAGSNVGVLVCGPQSLQVSVALECRRINHRHLNDKKAALHFHSLSFDL